MARDNSMRNATPSPDYNYAELTIQQTKGGGNLLPLFYLGKEIVRYTNSQSADTH